VRAESPVSLRRVRRSARSVTCGASAFRRVAVAQPSAHGSDSQAMAARPLMVGDLPVAL